nr:serine/arginine repetitive matrix protein 2-like isoform X1 [Nerophis lumbriciformis]
MASCFVNPNDVANRLFSGLLDSLNINAEDSALYEEKVEEVVSSFQCLHSARGYESCLEAGSPTTECFQEDNQGAVKAPSGQKFGHVEGKDCGEEKGTSPSLTPSSPEEESCESVGVLKSTQELLEHNNGSIASYPALPCLDDDVQGAANSAAGDRRDSLISKSRTSSSQEERNEDVSTASAFQAADSTEGYIDAEQEERVESKSSSCFSKEEHRGEPSHVANDRFLTQESSGNGNSPTSGSSSGSQGARKPSWSSSGHEYDHEDYDNITPEEKVSEEQYGDANRQGFNPAEVSSDEDQSRPSKSLSPSPRAEQKGIGTSPLANSYQESDPAKVDSERETPSKSLSPSPREVQKGDRTPPFSSDEDGEKPSKSLSPSKSFSSLKSSSPSKSLSPSPREVQKVDRTPLFGSDEDEEKPSKSLSPSKSFSSIKSPSPSKSSSPSPREKQELEPVEVNRDEDMDKPSKCLRSSPHNGWSPGEKTLLGSTCHESDLVKVDDDKGKPSKSSSPSKSFNSSTFSSPSPREEQKEDRTPPFTSSSQYSVSGEVNGDEDKEKPSQSLGTSPQEGQKGEGTSPLTYSSQESYLVDVDCKEEIVPNRLSKSLSPSKRLSVPEETLNVMHDSFQGSFRHGSSSEPVSHSPAGCGDNIPGQPHSCSSAQEVDQVESDDGVILEDMVSSICSTRTSRGKDQNEEMYAFTEQDRKPSTPERIRVDRGSPAFSPEGLVRLDFHCVEDLALQSLIPSLLEKRNSIDTPVPTSQGKVLMEADCASKSLRASTEVVAGISSVPELSQHLSSAPPDHTGDINAGVILEDMVSSICSTRTSRRKDQNEEMYAFTEQDRKPSTPERIRVDRGSPAFSPEGLVRLDFHCVEDMALKSLSPTLLEKRNSIDTPVPTSQGKVLMEADCASKSLEASTEVVAGISSVPELSQHLSSAPPDHTGDINAEATMEPTHISSCLEIRHKLKNASKSSPQENISSVTQLLEKLFCDALETCSSTLFQTLVSQVDANGATMNAGRPSRRPVKKPPRTMRLAEDVKDTIVESKSDVRPEKAASSPEVTATLDSIVHVEHDGGTASTTKSVSLRTDSSAELSGHGRLTADIPEEHPENATATLLSSGETTEDFKDVLLRRNKRKVHPVGSEKDASKHTCPYRLFKVLQKTTMSKENIQTSKKKHFTPEAPESMEKRETSKVFQTSARKSDVHSSEPGSLVAEASLPNSNTGHYMQKLKKFFARLGSCRVWPNKSTVHEDNKIDAPAKEQRHQTKTSSLKSFQKRIGTG